MQKLYYGLLLLALTVAFAVAQEGAGGTEAEPPVAQGVIRTASYGLFDLDGSGVTGNLNVSERVEGGTRLVVTLVGMSEGDLYLPVLFRGDCGPDRERLRALPAVGSIENDPYVSIFDSDLSFAELTEGDYFMYIFPGEDEEARPVACGEVGQGANQ